MKTKMKNVSILLGFLVSGSASAVGGGSEEVDWKQMPSLVKMNCTGTALAGKYVLTARHCSWESAGGLRPVYIQDGSTIDTVKQTSHPLADSIGVDIGLWELASNVPMNKIEYIADLNDPANNIQLGDNITLFGFGGTGLQLNKGTQVTHDPENRGEWWKVSLKDIGQGYHVPGDSGAPSYNTNNHIVALVSTGEEEVTPDGPVFTGQSTRLTYAKDFILETVDGWHYPTQLETNNGKATIKVQSLHQNNVSDAAYTDGDATITGGTCIGASDVQPFETCTYEVSSNGGEGKLYLTANEAITINKQVKLDPKPQPESNNGSESSGGSLGFFGLMGLLSLAWRRRG